MTERVQTGDGRAGGRRSEVRLQASKLLILRRGRGDTVSASTEDYSNLAFWYCCCSGNDTNPAIFIKKYIDKKIIEKTPLRK